MIRTELTLRRLSVYFGDSFLRTPLEQIWYDIFKENNISFEEQVPIGKYQADFIIGKFDIEVDGLQHRTIKRHVKHDLERDKYFESLGYTVIRIPMNYHSFHKKKHQKKFIQQVEMILDLLK